MPLSPRPRLGARDNGDVERDIHDHDNTDDEHVENQLAEDSDRHRSDT